MVNFIFGAGIIWGLFGILGAAGHFYAAQENGFGLESPIAFWSQVLLSILLVVSSTGFWKRSLLMTKLVGISWIGLFLSMAVVSLDAYKEFGSTGPLLGLVLFASFVAFLIKGLFSKVVRNHLAVYAT